MSIDVKDFILTYISFITPNIKIKEYVEKSIDLNGGKLIVSVCDRSSKDLGFKNGKNQHLYINISRNKIYVYNENDNGHEDFSFEKSDDGISIIYNSVIKDVHNDFLGYNCIEENGLYDVSGNLLYHSCLSSKNTYINGEVATRLMGSNYDKLVEDVVIDDKLVRRVSCNHYYLSDLDSIKYYLSDYKSDMLLNNYLSISPKFSLFDGDVSSLDEKFDFVKKNNIKIKKI